MKRICTVVKLIIIVVLFSNTGYGQYIISPFEYFNLWGYSDISNVKMPHDSLVLAKVDSLKSIVKARGGRGPESLLIYPKIVRHLDFSELPCVEYYQLRTTAPHTGLTYPFEMALFNKCNDEFYIFNGDMDHYNAVISGSLSSNFKNDNYIMALLLVYVNTIYGCALTNIFGSEGDLDFIYRNFPDEPYAHGFLYELNKMGQKRPDLMEPIIWQKEPTHYDITFNTYSYMNDIERWRFLVFPDSIVIAENDVIGKFSKNGYNPDSVTAWINTIFDARITSEDSLIDNKDSTAKDKINQPK